MHAPAGSVLLLLAVLLSIYGALDQEARRNWELIVIMTELISLEHS